MPRYPREIGELRKQLERHRDEAEKARKALEDKIAEELVLKGELDADEVRRVKVITIASNLVSGRRTTEVSM